MSELIAEVFKIEEILVHENADKLEIIPFKGWRTVVVKGMFKVGEMAVHIPIDCIMTLELSDKLGVTKYLASHNRVRAASIRGAKSFGIVAKIDILKDPNNRKIGENVAEELGLIKYEIDDFSGPHHGKRSRTPQKPWSLISSIKYIFSSWHNIIDRFNIVKSKPWLKGFGCPTYDLSLPGYPEFIKYTDIANLRYYPNVLNGMEVVVTEKIHGCLHGNTIIYLANGDKKSIKEIVDNKLNVEVLSLHNNQLVPNKIINYYDNGKTDVWLKFKYTRNGLNKGNYYGILICTPEHMIYNPIKKDYVRADEFNVDDYIYSTRSYLELSYMQKEILKGKLLGDGSLIWNKRGISFGHKKEHEEYLDYTLYMLGDIAGNKYKEKISGYDTIMCTGRSICAEYIGLEFKNWYLDGTKQIPNNITLSPISLAFWYQDDGTLTVNDGQEDRVMFATCGFNERSVDNLILALNKIGIIATKRYTDNKYFRIYLNSDNAEKLFSLIFPYITKCMQYKLPERYRGNESVKINNLSKGYKQKIVEQKILSIEKIYTNTQRYDIETELHNYIANGVIVHNCNFRVGMIKNKFLVGSHGVNRLQWDQDQFWKASKIYPLKDILKNGMILFGELYGKGVQKTMEYGLEYKDIVFFDLVIDGEYVDYDVFQEFCISNNLPYVPYIYRGIYDYNLIAKLGEGNSFLTDKHIKEGVVVKTAKETNHPNFGRLIYKYVNEDYSVGNYDGYNH